MRPPSFGRSLDRRLTVGGIGLAVCYLLIAGGSLLLPEAERRGLWLPLHLAFLGGGGVAIVAVLPFFAASLAAGPSPPPRLRLVAIAAVGVGAASLAAGFVVADPALAVAGGLLVLGGVGATAASLLSVLVADRGGRSSERARIARAVTAAGLGALGSLAVGGLLATLFLAGNASLAASWPTVRVAHAWLNVFGFVGLVVVSTLVHLLPTVLGTRVTWRATGIGAVVLLGASAVGGAVGFLVRSDLLACLGALGLVAAGLLLALDALRVWRARGRWTSDAGWHRFVIGSLLGGVAWFVVGLGIVAARTLAAGAEARAWDLRPLLAPLGAGWLASVFFGSASHLVPSIGPGNPERHAEIRRLLGRAATARLVAFHGGVVLVTASGLGAGGGPSGAASLGLLGSVVLLASGSTTAALLGRAVLALLRAP